ncbi:MAG: hypothetical protein MUF82_02560 [Bacteroidetes bacterium]|nr:hypothetical protein [Bacteroidota bacterium]
MNHRISRRDLLQFAGGSALGLLLSPLPWKLLDDSAIWTQNWPWNAEPLRGPVSNLLTTCSLCPSGCGLRFRCVSGSPISTHGIPGHPASHGTLCPAGLLAHHLRYHPQRISRPVRLAAGAPFVEATPLTTEEAFNAIGERLRSSKSTVVLDARPDRAASEVLKQLARTLANATYVPEHTERERTIRAMASAFDQPVKISFDLSSVRTILSVRAPLIDGWHSPDRAAAIFDRRAGTGSPLFIIHVDSTPSRTAEVADEWVKVHPGSEMAFVLGIIGALLDEGLTAPETRQRARDFAELRSALAPVSREWISAQCGITADKLHVIARRLATQGPSLALADGQPDPSGRSSALHAAVACLNLLTGSYRHRAPVRAYRGSNTESAPSLDAISDGSVDVFLADESISGSTSTEHLLAQKGSRNCLLISLSPFVVPHAAFEQIVLPAPAFGEMLTDVPGVSDDGRETLSVTIPAFRSQEGTFNTVDLCAALLRAVAGTADASPSTEELIKDRIASVLKAGKGHVFKSSDGTIVPIGSLSSSEELWTELTAGGAWSGDQPTQRPTGSFRLMRSARPALELCEQERRDSRSRFTHDEQSAPPAPARIVDPILQGTTVISPLISKLREESGLRPFHPEAFDQASSSPVSVKPSKA